MTETDESTYVMAVECNEPDGTHMREVRLCELTQAKLTHFYEKLRQFKVLFNDFIRDNPDMFVRSFISIDRYGEIFPNGLIWEVDDVGILMLTDIIPNKQAQAHFTFWDKRIRGREDLVRAMLKYVFGTFKLHRIVVDIPLYSPAALSAVERMGFRKEGRMREAELYEGRWFDVNRYSILETEV